jgi:simple sugar transport system substrate-binding protein/ribose transport system substrate-binding protein
MKKTGIVSIIAVLCVVLLTTGFAFAGDKLVIRVVFHGTGLSFAQPIKSGVEAAGEELGIDAELIGPVDSNIDEQVNIIENLITMKVDGIATSNINAEAMNPVIDKAIEAGIPVVTYNSEAPGSKRLAFYGQDLVESGRQQAKILVEYMGTKGKVLITTGDAPAAWSQAREKGVREGLAKHPDIEVVGIISTGWEEQKMYAALENALLANPDLAGFASLDSQTTQSIGRVILRHDVVGKIKHVGHDLMPETLDNIKAGASNASLSQDPFKQGYLPVKSLFEHVTEGKTLESVDTGILRVDENNIDTWLEKLEAGEPIG